MMAKNPISESILKSEIDIKFENLFKLKDIQRLQNLFSDTNNVASIITKPNGKPITKPSNFTRLCSGIIRNTKKGKLNCINSDSIIGRNNTSGPLIQPCLSCGLWDAGASITVGGKHIANWLIGQVRNEQLDEQKMIQYADEIEANREDFIEALNEVPVMTLEKFKKIAELLFLLSKELSEKAFNNLNLQIQISEHKKTIETLNNSESLYHDLVETAQDLVWQCNAEGKYTYLNPAWEDLFGYTTEEMLGKKFSDFQSQKWAERDVKEFNRLLKGNTVKGLETVHIGKNGEDINLIFNAKFVRDKNENIVGTRGTAFSITNIKKTQKALKESESKYSSLFSSMKEGVVLHELVYNSSKIAIDYKIVEANQAFKKHTGIDAENAKNQLASKFYGTKTAPYLDIYSKVAISGKSTQFDTHFAPLNKHFSISVFSPKKGWFATVFNDITERKQAEEKIKNQLEELKRFNATMIERELKMIQLKQEVNDYCDKLSLPLKYSIPTL